MAIFPEAALARCIGHVPASGYALGAMLFLNPQCDIYLTRMHKLIDICQQHAILCHAQDSYGKKAGIYIPGMLSIEIKGEYILLAYAAICALYPAGISQAWTQAERQAGLHPCILARYGYVNIFTMLVGVLMTAYISVFFVAGISTH